MLPLLLNSLAAAPGLSLFDCRNFFCNACLSFSSCCFFTQVSYDSLSIRFCSFLQNSHHCHWTSQETMPEILTSSPLGASSLPFLLSSLHFLCRLPSPSLLASLHDLFSSPFSGLEVEITSNKYGIAKCV